jgi:hypothetical protein
MSSPLRAPHAALGELSTTNPVAINRCETIRRASTDRRYVAAGAAPFYRPDHHRRCCAQGTDVKMI